MQTIAITGATGFIGRHLLSKLQNRTETTIRILTRLRPEQEISRPNNKLCWIYGDLAEPSAAANLLIPGSTLINLAFPAHWPRSSHIEGTKRLAEAAAKRSVRRVIHCSTAAVVGNTRQQNVTEIAKAMPQTEYEKTKLVIEQTWRASAEGRFDLVIARPSAVFGPGGRNLVKLADALTGRSKIISYVRSILYSRRKMNLVSVSNVVSAFETLLDRKESFNGDTFNISDDDDPLNNFRDVERVLMRELGVDDYALPHLSAPQSLLAALLSLAGRSNTDPSRIYDSTKLQKIGWRRDCNIEQGLFEFARWYLSSRRGA